MQAFRGCETLNSNDVTLAVHDCECEAGIDAASIYNGGAGATLPVVTSLLCASERKMFSQCVKESCPRINLEMMDVAVDG